MLGVTAELCPSVKTAELLQRIDHWHHLRFEWIELKILV